MIFVENEFARLRKVVLAESEFGFPLEPRAQDLKFLDEEAIRENFENRGKDYGEAFPQHQLQWEHERAELYRVLRKYNVEVLRPRKLTLQEKQAGGRNGYANFFTRDPFFTIGNHVIEGSLRMLHRRHEIFPVRPVIEQEVYSQDCTYVAVPQPEITSSCSMAHGNGPFLEGGDLLVFGKHILAGNSGLASDERGIEWLGKLLAPSGYLIEQVPLHPEILHLDCALGLIKPGVAVICEEAFPQGIPSVLKSWKKIRVSLSEAKALATNGLPVSTDVYITDPVFEHIGTQIEREGVQVEYIDFSISRSFGGSFRCSTQPLLRMD